MAKLLSIIIPSYNMEKYLDKCINSCIVDDDDLLQTLDIIVVNDGSKDRTSEIGHCWEKKHPGVVRVIDKQNGNYGSCINAALPMALGKYVKVLDADDWFDTKEFTCYLKYLFLSNADLIISDYAVVAVEGNAATSIEGHSFSLPKDEVFDLSKITECKDYMPMHAFTYASQRLREIGYTQCEGVSYSDTEWITIPLANVRNVGYCQFCVYQYQRGREGQTMDPAVHAKHTWMYGVVALHALKQFDALTKMSLDAVSMDIVHASIYKMVEGVYRNGILSGSCGGNPEKLRQFDVKIKSDFSNCYRKTDECIYSHRLPYHYVHGWRIHWRWHRMMMRICRLYSRLANGCRFD